MLTAQKSSIEQATQFVHWLLQKKTGFLKYFDYLWLNIALNKVTKKKQT